MKLILIIFLLFSQVTIASEHVSLSGRVTGSNIKHPISQRKWYEAHNGEAKYIFVNIGYHRYLNGFCHSGGSSVKHLMKYKSEQYNLSKHYCLNFNGNRKNETFFLLKTKNKHYLKIAQCTHDNKVASLAYAIAYNNRAQGIEDKAQKYCSLKKNRKPLLFNKSSELNTFISEAECQKLVVFIYNALSEKNWQAYNCSN